MRSQVADCTKSLACLSRPCLLHPERTCWNLRIVVAAEALLQEDLCVHWLKHRGRSLDSTSHCLLSLFKQRSVQASVIELCCGYLLWPHANAQLALHHAQHRAEWTELSFTASCWLQSAEQHVGATARDSFWKRAIECCSNAVQCCSSMPSSMP